MTRDRYKWYMLICAFIECFGFSLGCEDFVVKPPNHISLAAYYPFNGNANDESGNGHHGTVLGGAIFTADRLGNPQSACSFDGVDDYIAVNNFPLLDRTFTYAAWLKVLGTTQNNQSFGAHGEGGATGETWNFSYNTFRKRWDVFDRSNNTWLVNIDIGTAWTHVAIVYDNNVQHLYVNGVLRESRNITTPVLAGLSNTLRIGTLIPGDQQFQGLIDEVRIYSQALNEAEIRELCGYDGGLVAYYPFNGNANDESGNGNNGIVSGCTPTEDRFGNQNKAYMFNGISNLINCGHGSSLQLTNSLTLSAWFKPASSKLGEYIIGKASYTIPGYEYLICFDYSEGVTGWGLKTDVGGKDFDEVGTNWTPQDTKWHHVVVAFSYPGQLRLFLDGNLIASKNSTGNIEPTTQDMVIGCIRPSGEPSMRYFDGALDDIRIYNRALGDTEIKQLYHEGGWGN